MKNSLNAENLSTWSMKAYATYARIRQSTQNYSFKFKILKKTPVGVYKVGGRIFSIGNIVKVL